MKNTIDTSKTYPTGELCPESGQYCCESHTYLEKYVKKGDFFPKCSKSNCGYTNWFKVITKSH
jgi:hypothetical protein